MCAHGFYYNCKTKDPENKDNVRWGCEDYGSTKCPGTGNSHGLKPPFNALNIHNHMPNFVRLAHIKGDELVEDCALNSNDKPRVIINKFYGKMSKREIANAKSRSAISQKVRRKRQKKLGKVPVAHTVEEIIIPSRNILQSLKMVKKLMKEKHSIMMIVQQSLHTELFYSPLNLI